ncbi:hypothetical protein [Actinoplanes sp. NBRC 101535]|uniref:hypothetical protein n=1 Tax=Actinoplanes sp. NBRC 101535 TaxID=3032196 RepID=UPI0024A1C094|nr:hypothetical protein [Actinoplanes sp. NBRC 101535]GLY01278.1 hypothetical protein Acsp01_16570 [Actinoplanes sp. NBRC 101535]
MRVFRTILGMLLLTIGLPALLAAGGLWTVMQHRDPGGAFSGELQRLTVPGYALVVPDIDQLLRSDAPFARIGGTELRLSALTTNGPAFVGLAPSADAARYLDGVPFSQVGAVSVGTGILPVSATPVAGHRAPAGSPAGERIWTRSGTGQLAFTPEELAGGPYSLIVMNTSGNPLSRLATVAEIRPGWMNSSTWGLFTLGTLLVMAGFIALTWPGRHREVVYVVEPSQVPELMHAIGAPLPLGPGPRHSGVYRQRALTATWSGPAPALPEFIWPPRHQPGGPGSPDPASDPAAPGSVARGTAASGTAARGSVVTGSATVVSYGEVLPAVPVPPGARTPAPGEPLSLFGEPAALTGLQLAGPPENAPAPGRRDTRRRDPAPGDLPEFHATAVGAWVAATAPERARQTEARAAARLAEAARRSAPAQFAPEQPFTESASSQPTFSPSDEPAFSPSGQPAFSEQEPEPESDLEPATIPAESGATARRAIAAPREASEPVTEDDTASTEQRVAISTGPAATDWTATGSMPLGMTRFAQEQASPEAEEAAGKTPAKTDDPKPDDGKPVPAEPKRPIVPFPSRPVTPEPVPARSEAATEDITVTQETFGGAADATVESGTPAEAAGKVVPARRRPSVHATEAGPLLDAPTAETTTVVKAVGRATVAPAPPRPIPAPADPERPSIHEAEAPVTPIPDPTAVPTSPSVPAAAPAAVPTPGPVSVPAPAQASAPTPAAGPKKPSAANNPLTRAQSRTSGKGLAPAGPRQAPQTRRIPASWLKAAETVAARVAQSAPEAATVEAASPAEEAETAPPVEKPDKGDKAEQNEARRALPGDKRRPSPRPKPGTAPKPAQDGARSRNYREEAAELLAGSPEQERRRRRTVAGRPAAAQDGPAEPDGS